MGRGRICIFSILKAKLGPELFFKNAKNESIPPVMDRQRAHCHPRYSSRGWRCQGKNSFKRWEALWMKGTLRDQGLASDARGAFLLSDLLSPRFLICKIVMVVILSI